MIQTPERSRWIALVVLCVGMLMIVLDATIVNVALPSIRSDLGFSQANLAWVVNAYLISFGGLLLLAGRVIGTLSLGFSERLNMRFGPRAGLLPSLVLIAAALALFARAPVDGNYVTDALPVMVLMGMGAGLAFPALMTLAMSGATRSDSGLASGLVN